MNPSNEYMARQRILTLRASSSVCNTSKKKKQRKLIYIGIKIYFSMLICKNSFFHFDSKTMSCQITKIRGWSTYWLSVEGFLLKGNAYPDLKIPLTSLSFLEVWNHKHLTYWKIYLEKGIDAARICNDGVGNALFQIMNLTPGEFMLSKESALRLVLLFYINTANPCFN